VANHEKRFNFINEISKQSIISENEWQYYIDEVNHLFDGKIIKIKNEFKEITQSDLIVIALIIMQIDITNCCSLLNMSSNTMYIRRKRIKKHIGLNKEIGLEMWIHEYLNLNG